MSQVWRPSGGELHLRLDELVPGALFVAGDDAGRHVLVTYVGRRPGALAGWNEHLLLVQGAIMVTVTEVDHDADHYRVVAG